ncbi:MAG TPA: helix-turn-helix domain-containing protein [Pseudonocardiaceae bacterium]
MSDDGIEAQVRQLRESGLPPKLIARKLGVPVSTVGRLVAAIAAQRPPSDEVVGCWVSPGWSRALVVAADRHWPDRDVGRTDEAGLVAVLVSRRHRHDKVSVCGYLVDVHCLGVKNAVGPRVMDQRESLAFIRSFFAVFDGDPVPAPFELAQHLVLGAVEYARGLGFQPHSDFAAAAGHLGAWAGPSDITFGRDGKPFYMQGPYDNPMAVIQTLNRTVGRDNYHYVIAVA